MNRIRVLVADDHVVVRMGLAAIIRHEPDLELVAEAANGQEVLDLAHAHRPDVVVMDLRMPGLAGDAVIARLATDCPKVRVLVLTIHKGDAAAVQAVRAGARGYLPKDVGAQEIVAAVRQIHAGGTCLAPEIASQVAERLGARELTPRERQVLRLMYDGFSNRELAGHLGLAEATAEKHVSAVLAKLGARDRVQAIKRALERGILDLDS
jgi:DNA-binding NarL/FixJ family response regulator